MQFASLFRIPKFHPCAALLFASGFLIFFTQPTLGRMWTAKSGQTMEGDFVRLRGVTVVIKGPSKPITVPLSSLSEEDQSWIQSFEASGKVREWKRTDGIAAKGKFSKIQDDELVLKTSSGDITIPWNELTMADRLLVRNIVTDLETGDRLPSMHAEEVLAMESTAELKDKAEKDLPAQIAEILKDDIWTDVRGRKIKAEYVQKDDQGNLVFKKGLDTISVPLNQLSKIDQDRIMHVEQLKESLKPRDPPIANGHGIAGTGGNPYQPRGSNLGETQADPLNRMVEQQNVAMRSNMEAHQRMRDQMASSFPSTPNIPTYSPPLRPEVKWIRKCSKCGQEVSDQDANCPHCGVNFLNGGSKRNPVANSPSSNRRNSGPNSTAYNVGYRAGQITAYAVITLVVVFFISKVIRG